MKVIVEADGGSRGNPGPAGYGSVVWTADHGTVLAESKQAIGRATNNVAEYRGLIAGLEEAAKLGATEVEVLMDSKLVVEQMSGRWQVKHPDLRALLKQAKALDGRFDRISYAWIPRAKNSHADRLANEAMDAAAELEEAEPAADREDCETHRNAGLARRMDRCSRHPDPLSAAAARADRIVHAAAVFRPWESGADRRRPPSGRGRRAVPGASGAASRRSSRRRCSAPTTPRRRPPRRWGSTSSSTTT